jgi:hypothetical protein
MSWQAQWKKLREIRGAIAALRLERANHETLTSAFEDTVQQGQAAISLAFKDQQDEHLHECPEANQRSALSTRVLAQNVA